MIIRVHMHHNGDAWSVDLPQFSIISDSFKPIISDVVGKNGISRGVSPNSELASTITCEGRVPDRISDLSAGTLDIAKIRELYRGNPKWDNENLGQRMADLVRK